MLDGLFERRTDMNLKKIITEETVRLSLAGSTKEEILEELLQIVESAGCVSDHRSALSALLAREAKMSTALQNGIAMPHAKTDAVTKLVGAIALKKEGVDFGSIDGQPTRIFILTLSPLNRAGPHIQFLAEVGRLLTQPDTQNRMLAANSPSEIVALFQD